MRINIAGLCIQIEEGIFPLSLEDLPCHFKFRDVPGLERYLRDSIAGQPELAFAALVRGDGIIVLHSTSGMAGRGPMGLKVPGVQGLQTRVAPCG